MLSEASHFQILFSCTDTFFRLSPLVLQWKFSCRVALSGWVSLGNFSQKGFHCLWEWAQGKSTWCLFKGPQAPLNCSSDLSWKDLVHHPWNESFCLAYTNQLHLGQIRDSWEEQFYGWSQQRCLGWGLRSPVCPAHPVRGAALGVSPKASLSARTVCVHRLYTQIVCVEITDAANNITTAHNVRESWALNKVCSEVKDAEKQSWMGTRKQ